MKVEATIERAPLPLVEEASVQIAMPESQAKFLMGLLSHVRLVTKQADNALAIYQALADAGIVRDSFRLEGYCGPYTTNTDRSKINITAIDGTIVVKERNER